MYDDNVKTVGLTDDEIDILNKLLSHRLDSCVSIGEEITIRDLMDKLN